MEKTMKIIEDHLDCTYEIPLIQEAETSFESVLDKYNIHLKRRAVKTLQINIGKLCNQACTHCHVEAGPKRPENMELNTVSRILELIRKDLLIETIDITGGAPELNPFFRYLVQELTKIHKKIIVRCNLTVLFEENQEDTPDFFADNKVEIVASLPCYIEENVNSQRGKDVFKKSVKALQILNNLGYGVAGSGLFLNLVYNPIGEHLPPEQTQLESDYKSHLKSEFNIVFNQLFTITNMPIKRYEHMLIRDGKMKDYMRLLTDNFNPIAAKEVMCQDLISISWDGEIYDCDFNQMLEIPLNWNRKTIWDINNFSDIGQDIAFARHCFGCAAGTGSSCSGALL
jgi:radical SAM/Cys-rich protein